MKMYTFILIFLFSVINLIAQSYSLSLTYSHLISSTNYESASTFTFENDYEVLENTLSLGLAISVINAELSPTFIKYPPPTKPEESSLKYGFQFKFYPLFFLNGSTKVKPFLGFEIGKYGSDYIRTFYNMPSSCEETYRFEDFTNLYTNFNFAAVVLPDKSVSFLFGVKYQFNSPQITYDKPNCDETYLSTKYTEKVKLDIFLWNLGFKINF